MTLHPIKDFVALNKARNNSRPNWPKILRSGGHYSVAYEDERDEDIEELLAWCRETMPDRFVWTGYYDVFWFESEKDAALFKLRWT